VKKIGGERQVEREVSNPSYPVPRGSLKYVSAIWSKEKTERGRTMNVQGHLPGESAVLLERCSPGTGSDSSAESASKMARPLSISTKRFARDAPRQYIAFAAGPWS